MPRRLLDNDPQRERRRQMQIIGGIVSQFRKRYRDEIERASIAMLERWEAVGGIDNDDEHAKRIQSIMRQNWRSSIRAMAGRIREQAKAKGHPTVTKAEAEDAFALYEKEFLQAVGAQHVQNVTETTKKQIAAQIERGRQAGESVDEIAKSIRDRVPAIAGVRANVIARTETHSAGNDAANRQAKDTGVVKKKEWIAANDKRTRDADDAFNHERADGQTVGLDEAFIVGSEDLEYPGDTRGSAGNIINCRCAVGYIVED